MLAGKLKHRVDIYQPPAQNPIAGAYAGITARLDNRFEEQGELLDRTPYVIRLRESRAYELACGMTIHQRCARGLPKVYSVISVIDGLYRGELVANCRLFKGQTLLRADGLTEVTGFIRRETQNFTIGNDYLVNQQEEQQLELLRHQFSVLPGEGDKFTLPSTGEVFHIKSGVLSDNGNIIIYNVRCRLPEKKEC